MRRIRWTARELLTRNGFDDGMFAPTYALANGHIVLPDSCTGSSFSTVRSQSFVEGDQYPDYVLCLVELLRKRGLQHLVLRDPEIGSHNVDRLQSFVWHDTLYAEGPEEADWQAKLPQLLLPVFDEVAVIVEIDDDRREEKTHTLV